MSTTSMLGPGGDPAGAEDGATVPVRRRRPVAPLVALAVALVVAALVAVFARSQPANQRQAHSPLVGGPAPLLAGPTTDGGSFELASRRGRWVVVNFMASWCAPCREEQPELARFAARHATAGDAQVVAVVVDDDPGAVDRFFAEYGGTWPRVLDPEGRAYADFGVVRVPETFVVDPDGIVRAKLNGSVTADSLDAILLTASCQRAGVGQ